MLFHGMVENIDFSPLSRDVGEEPMSDNAYLQFIESKVIDAGETVTAKTLSVDLNISLCRARSLLTEFVKQSESDLTYYFVEIADQKVILKSKKSSEFSAGNVVEAVASEHQCENLVRNDLEYLLENRLGNAIRF